jgi:hypothetical protein
MSQAQFRIGGRRAGTSSGRRCRGGIRMKITIIKKSTKSAKPQGSCDFYVDDYPMNKR